MGSEPPVHIRDGPVRETGELIREELGPPEVIYTPTHHKPASRFP